MHSLISSGKGGCTNCYDTINYPNKHVFRGWGTQTCSSHSPPPSSCSREVFDQHLTPASDPTWHRPISGGSALDCYAYSSPLCPLSERAVGEALTLSQHAASSVVTVVMSLHNKARRNISVRRFHRRGHWG
jgi:hypothetical protein